MNFKIRHDSIAVRCEEYPSIDWVEPTDEMIQQREGTHIWWIDNKVFTKTEIACFWEELSFGEKEKALRFHFERDRKRYVLTHGILRTLLGKYFSSQNEFLFSENIYGKPFLAENKNFEFNISHSSNFILIGFRFSKSDFQIGVDVEKVKMDFDFGLILDNFFSKKEKNTIWESENSINTFFQMWTRKEALVKATGRGLMEKLFRFDVSQKVNMWMLNEKDFSKFNSNNFFIHSFKIKNYSASVALMNEDSKLQFYKYR